MQARPKVSDGGHPSSVAVLRSVDEARRLQQQRDTAVRCHDGLKRGPLKATLMLMIKTYILKPTMTLNTLSTHSRARHDVRVEDYNHRRRERTSSTACSTATSSSEVGLD